MAGPAFLTHAKKYVETAFWSAQNHVTMEIDLTSKAAYKPA